ncbi:hypothetical protein D9615_003296 [Tricholomella constricta]|uniref:Uncharacterized protein n=1 Tax=Tricholomella constricta TaxID=117010 RepID=A0A8H5HJB5_9AGAR|nr:hypothetical protein D9615_003296 [Tricholomella constricta]
MSQWLVSYRSKKAARDQERSPVPFQYAYASPPFTAVREDAPVVTPFRLSKYSNSTNGSPVSPMNEMRKPFAPEPRIVFRTPSLRSNMTLGASTLVADDGSRSPVNQDSRRSRRKPKGRPRVAGNSVQMPPPEILQHRSDAMHVEYESTMSIDPIPEMRESVQVTSLPQYHSGDRDASTFWHEHDDSDAVYESDSGSSSHASHPRTPAPTLLSL